MSAREAVLVAPRLAAARDPTRRGCPGRATQRDAVELHGTGTSHEKSDNTKLVLEDRA